MDSVKFDIVTDPPPEGDVVESMDESLKDKDKLVEQCGISAEENLTNSNQDGTASDGNVDKMPATNANETRPTVIVPNPAIGRSGRNHFISCASLFLLHPKFLSLLSEYFFHPNLVSYRFRI